MEATVDDKAEMWRDRIEAQRGSGQSVRGWCKANDSREHSFYWWRARLGLSPARRPAGQPFKPVAFARVVVRPRGSGWVVPPSAAEAKPAAAEALRLRLGGERELIFPACMPLEQVAKLVRAIEATA